MMVATILAGVVKMMESIIDPIMIKNYPAKFNSGNIYLNKDDAENKENIYSDSEKQKLMKQLKLYNWFYRKCLKK